MKIAILGTGYVGLNTAAAFAWLGHDVRIIDKDRTYIHHPEPSPRSGSRDPMPTDRPPRAPDKFAGRTNRAAAHPAKPFAPRQDQAQP